MHTVERCLTALVLTSSRLPRKAALPILALIAVGGFLPVAWSFFVPPEDPLPIQRVAISRDRLPAEMERLNLKTLVALSRQDFEERVRRASQAGEAIKSPPSLVEAQYSARLSDVTGTALTGPGLWKILNPGPGAGILSVQPLNLALSEVRVGNSDALLADLDARGPGLLLEQSGEQSATFNWSARGEARPGGLHFDLDVPPAPIASLELDLPRDLRVTDTPDGCLLTGPLPAAAEDRSLWRITFGRRAQVHLALRRAHEPDRPRPLVEARLQTTQTLTPDFLQADFAFALTIPYQSVRELRCEFDARLKPYDVVVPGLEGWSVVPPPAPLPPRQGQPAAKEPAATLFVRLREPLGQAGQLLVHCHAPLLADPGRGDLWTCPGMRLVSTDETNAVSRGETLVLRVHPDIHIEDWHAGHFRLTGLASETEGGDAYIVRTLSGGGLDVADPANRPRAHLLTRGADYRARQLAWWQPGLESSVYTAQISYEVHRGRLLQLPLQLPPDWEVARVETTPRTLLGSTHLRQQGGKSLLLVDLQRALTEPGLESGGDEPRIGPPFEPRSAAALRLTVELRRGRAPSGSFVFPELLALGGRWQEGALAVTIDDKVYQARVATPMVALATPEEEGPWEKHAPSLFYPYRNEPVRGSLTLKPLASRLHSTSITDVFLTSGQVAVQVRLILQAEVGNPDSVDLVIASPVLRRWEAHDWKVEGGRNEVRRWERLPAFDAAPWVALLGHQPLLSTLDIAAGLLAERGSLPQRYRLTLARPLSTHEPLTLRCDFQATTHDGRCEVPLLAAPAGEQLDGEVHVFLAGADMVHLEADGLQQLPAVSRPGGPTPYRTFRYGSAPVALTLSGLTPAADRSVEAGADQAILTTYVEPSGRLLHRFRFQLWSRRSRPLPLMLRLPDGTRLLAVWVNGRRVERREGALPGAALELPVPDGAAVHAYEVLYASDAPAWRVWQRLDDPPPSLSVAMVGFRRTWCLPPGALPLFAERYRLLPGSGAGRSADGDLLDSLPFRACLFDLSLTDDWAGRQTRLLEEGSSAVAAHWHTGQTMTLGQLLDHLVYGPSALRDKARLVLDTTALSRAGLSADTRLPGDPAALAGADRPLWESLDLVHLPCRSAPLLTTRRQLEEWQSGSSSAATGALAEAIAEAAAFGHDRSGRFHSAADWLSSAAAGPVSATNLSTSEPTTFPVEAYGPEWTEWELLAGNPAETPLVIVRQETLGALPLVGLLLTVFLTIGFVALVLHGHLAERRPRRGPAWRRSLAFLIVWLTAAGLAFLWLPPALRGFVCWPLLTAGTLAAACYLLAACGFIPRTSGSAASIQSRTSARFTGVGPAAALPLVLLLLIGGLGPGDHRLKAAGDTVPAPATVIIVPADGPDKETAYSPPELLDRLDRLAQRGAAGLRGAVLVDARYQGKTAGDTALFTAVFKVHCFTDDPTTVTLPLGGVKLQDKALLDGARAYPVALRAPRSGYSLQVKGRGPHTVELDFAVDVQGTGAERQLEFTVPPLLQNQLAFDAPGGVAYLQARMERNPVWGRQQVQRGAQGTHLEAELGRLVSPLRLIWRKADAHTEKPDVQEYYLWEVRGDATDLLALLNYTIPEGSSLSEVSVELPDGLEVKAVKATTWPERLPLRLRDWLRPENTGRRRLHVLFPAPVSGRLQLALQLPRAQPFAEAAELALPNPLDVRSASGEVALSLDGLEAHGVRALSANDAHAARFAQLWREAGGNAPPGPWQPTQAWTFERRPGEAPSLRLSFHLPTDSARAEQEVAWRVGPQQAEFHATVRITAPGDDLALLEWEFLPANVNLTSVTGPDVRSWSQVGGRVQVWLDHPVASTSVSLGGWQPLPRNAPQFGVPWVHLLSARNQTQTVRLTADPGLALQPLLLRLLDPLPGQHSGQEWAYAAQQTFYAASFAIHRAATQVDVRSLSLVEADEQKLSFTATLSCQARQGDLRFLTLRLRNWEGEVTRVDTPRQVQRQERPGEGGKVWSLELPPGTTGWYTVTVAGSLPLNQAAAGLPMPELTVDEADPQHTQRWLAVAGPALGAEGARDLAVASTAELVDVQRDWPPEAERIRRASGTIWKVKGADWSLHLQPRARPRGGAPVRVFLTECAAAVVDGRRWVHEATFWLYHEANTDLSFQLPAGARVLAAAVDDADVTPLQPLPDRLWLPLPGGEGASWIRLRWVFDSGAEALDAPRLDRPLLEGAADGVVSWTVDTPDGYHSPVAAPEASGQTHQVGAGRIALQRARAQLDLCQLLASAVSGSETAAAQFRAAQKRYFLARRQAASLPSTSPGREPSDDRVLHSLLAELDVRNDRLTAEPSLKRLRELAESEGRLDTRPTPVETRRPGEQEEEGAHAASSLRLLALPERGTPTYWETESAVPSLRLASLQTGERTGTIAYSLLFVALVAASWLLSSSLWLRSWAMAFWPEQVAVAACLLWRQTEFSPAVLALLLLALGGRLCFLGSGSWALVARLRRIAVPGAVAPGPVVPTPAEDVPGSP